jgi:uncharacterized protein affecting Mg2+/Co2+ transport
VRSISLTLSFPFFFSFFFSTNDCGNLELAPPFHQMVSLAAVTYRSILKRVNAASRHYEHDARKVVRSVFGINIALEALLASNIVGKVPLPLSSFSEDGSLNISGEQQRKANVALVRFVASRCFRHCATNLPPTIAIAAGFDVIRRLQYSVPLAEAEANFRVASASKVILLSDDQERDPMDGVLSVAEPKVIVPVEGPEARELYRAMLPSACVECDPFHVVTRMFTYRFDFAAVALEAESAWAKDPLSGVKGEDALSDSAASKSLPHQLPTSASIVSGNGVVEVAIRTNFVGLSEQKSSGDDEDDTEVSKGVVHCFQYHVSIRNLTKRNSAGSVRLRLLSRHWAFTSLAEAGSHSTVHEVVGPGVIGEFPHLGPGDCHTYVSGTSLTSPTGFMKGLFQLVQTPSALPLAQLKKEQCVCFDAVVPTVALLG